MPDIFATSPLDARIVDNWVNLAKSLPTVLKSPRKMPDGKPMTAVQLTTLQKDAATLMQKVPELTPKVGQLKPATTVRARRLLLADLEKRTAAASKLISDFKKSDPTHGALGVLLGRSMDALHSHLVAVHKLYAEYETGKRPIPTT
jgi:hypothetical protein